MGVAELAAAIAARQTSAVEAAQHLLVRARQHEGLGAYLAFNEDATLAQARAADARLAAGERGPLLGVPLAHKDIFVTTDFPTTAGSKMLQGYQSPFNATVVQRLADAGAVSLGKLNCDEFAMGSGNDNSAYAPAHNPWDVSRVPGGSSGGSAAAVAASLAADQDLFWPYHDYLFANLRGENVGSYDLDRLQEIGEAVGLDMDQFREGLQLENARERFAQIQAESRRDAAALGISATPTVTVNGVPLLAPDPATVAGAIDVALSQVAPADEEAPEAEETADADG